MDATSTVIQRQIATFLQSHKRSQSVRLDATIKELLEKASKDQKSNKNKALLSAREYLTQKVSDKTSLSPSLLSFLFLDPTNYPAEATSSDEQDAVKIAQFAVRYIVESSSFADWGVRLKWLAASFPDTVVATAVDKYDTPRQIDLYLYAIS